MWSNFTNADQIAAFQPLLAECKTQNIDVTSIPQEQLGDSLDAAEAGGVPATRRSTDISSGSLTSARRPVWA